MSEESYTSYAEKFDRLLELFPHPERKDDAEPERRKWRMYELVAASRGELSDGYLSSIRRGKNKKPGMRRLDMIANIVGFPFELWLTEPEQWPAIIAREYGEKVEGGPHGSNASAKESYAELLEQLFSMVTNRKTGRLFTESEVAERTNGELTEADVRALRAGTFNRPSRAELIALSNAFGIDVSYWFGSSENRPLLDETVQDLLQGRRDQRRFEMLKKSFGCSDEEVDTLLTFMSQLENRRRKDEK